MLKPVTKKQSDIDAAVKQFERCVEDFIRVRCAMATLDTNTASEFSAIRDAAATKRDDAKLRLMSLINQLPK